MEILIYKIKIEFTHALILSILAPLSLVGMILGAVFQKWALMGVSIGVVAISFYAIPLFWIAFANNKKLKRISLAITNDNILKIKDLASNFDLPVQEMIACVRRLLMRRYLIGYILVNDTYLKKVEIQGEIEYIKCPNCGSNLVKNKNNKYQCKYCDSEFSLNN